LIILLATVPALVPPTPRAEAATDVLLMAAGDISCDPASPPFNSGAGTATKCNEKYTAQDLIKANSQVPKWVLTLGDNQYKDGTSTQFTNSFDLGGTNSAWGKTKLSTGAAIKSIIKPSPGDHDWNSGSGNASIAGYQSYFFGLTDPLTYVRDYSFNVAVGSNPVAWHIISIDSHYCTLGSNECLYGHPTYNWLKTDLTNLPAGNQCILAYWSHPRFSSGSTHGNDPDVGDLWNLLYYGPSYTPSNPGSPGSNTADIVLNGHEHLYEKFAQQSPMRMPTTAGIREFTVGTGGDSLYPFSPTPQPNSQKQLNSQFGVLLLNLRGTSYAYHYNTEAYNPSNGTVTVTKDADMGSNACHI
jgi:hypothetical protein